MLLRQIRKQKGMTQGQLSELSGVPVPNISEIENGANCTVKTLNKLADALGVSPGEFFPDNASGRSPQASELVG